MSRGREKGLLEEYIEQIREALPDEINLYNWINNADRFDVAGVCDTEDLDRTLAVSLCYQWGRLLGYAECVDMAVLELLDFYEVFIEEPEPACTLYSALCSRHDFVHGAEAEELRAGIEELIGEGGASMTALQLLVDKIDARDSLAYREAHDDKARPWCQSWAQDESGGPVGQK